MSYRFSEPHEYVDLSKRRPFICGVCLLPITHELHQPMLEGTEAFRRLATRQEHPEEALSLPFAETQPTLF